MNKGKIFRQLKCFCISLLLLLTIFCATPARAGEGTAEVSFGNVSSKIGREVAVPVTIKNNPGFSTFRFRVSYNATDLELLSVENGTLTQGGTVMYSADTLRQHVTFTWYTVGTEVREDGEIAILRFKVNDTAKGKYPLTVTYLPEDMLNSDYEQVPYTVLDGSIATGSTLSGSIESFGEKGETTTVRLLENGKEISKVESTDGTYSFTYIAPGKYILEVSQASHATRNYEITVTSEDIINDVKIHLMGDIDGDGRVNTIDVNRAYAHASQTAALTDYGLVCADVAGADGVVNGDDVDRIFAHVRRVDPLW